MSTVVQKYLGYNRHIINEAFLLSITDLKFDFELLTNINNSISNPNPNKNFYLSEELFLIVENHYKDSKDKNARDEINYVMQMLLYNLIDDLKTRYNFC